MLDFAKIKIQAGNGGRGAISFHREKFVPKGGPDGGDGGKGGDFYIVASNDVATLLDFQFLDHFEAQRGEPGGTTLKAGKDGKDYVLKVPVGTIIKINKLVADLPENNKRKRDHREPTRYIQKVFNYKRSEKLKRQEMVRAAKESEEQRGDNAGIIESQHSVAPDKILPTKAHATEQNDWDEEVFEEQSSGEPFKELPSEHYKVYKFSEAPKSIDSTEDTQNNKSVDAGPAPIFDLDTEGKQILIARGGRGGRGNTRFKSNENKAPYVAEPGQQGEYVEIEITLKMVANVGLIGFPNAGKSTLLSKLTAASPKIANYPFTTLEPNLGVTYIDDRPVVVADIPGLIEGASEGKGLGFKFLRHIERTEIVVHMIAIPERDQFSTPEELSEKVLQAYNTVREELVRYGQTLPEKKEIIAINKIDILSQDERSMYMKAVEEGIKTLNKPYAFISAHEERGVSGLKKIIGQNIQQLNPATIDQASE
jgi:GTP-binding protein